MPQRQLLASLKSNSGSGLSVVRAGIGIVQAVVSALLSLVFLLDLEPLLMFFGVALVTAPSFSSLLCCTLAFFWRRQTRNMAGTIATIWNLQDVRKRFLDRPGITVGELAIEEAVLPSAVPELKCNKTILRRISPGWKPLSSAKVACLRVFAVAGINSGPPICYINMLGPSLAFLREPGGLRPFPNPANNPATGTSLEDAAEARWADVNGAPSAAWVRFELTRAVAHSALSRNWLWQRDWSLDAQHLSLACLLVLLAPGSMPCLFAACAYALGRGGLARRAFRPQLWTGQPRTHTADPRLERRADRFVLSTIENKQERTEMAVLLLGTWALKTKAAGYRFRERAEALDRQCNILTLLIGSGIAGRAVTLGGLVRSGALILVILVAYFLSGTIATLAIGSMLLGVLGVELAFSVVFLSLHLKAGRLQRLVFQRLDRFKVGQSQRHASTAGRTATSDEPGQVALLAPDPADYSDPEPRPWLTALVTACGSTGYLAAYLLIVSQLARDPHALVWLEPLFLLGYPLAVWGFTRSARAGSAAFVIASGTSCSLAAAFAVQRFVH